MIRRTLFLLAPAGLLGTLLLGLLPAVAEKPLSSPAQLAASATHIVRGTIEGVFPRVRRSGKWETTDYVAEVKVATLEKGDGIRLDRPLYVRYWTKSWKGSASRAPTGTTGHSPLPKEGAAVRLYLARNAYDGFGTERHDGGYNVIGVNGIHLLSAEEVLKADAGTKPQTALTFPASWSGLWRGELKISKPGGEGTQTSMFIAIRPTDDAKRWEFRLRYGKGQPQRKYELVVREAAAGRYEIDEKNGIVLPATYVDGELFSYFSLGGALLMARYRLVGDFLHFDLTQTRLAPDVQAGSAGASEVGGHHVQVLQRAKLRR